MIKYEIFGGEGCSYCVKAKELLQSKNIPHTYKDVNEDFEAFDQLVGRIGKWNTIPQIFFGGLHIGGYDDLVKFIGAVESYSGDETKRIFDLVDANNRYLDRARQAEYLLKEAMPVLNSESLRQKIKYHLDLIYTD